MEYILGKFWEYFNAVSVVFSFAAALFALLTLVELYQEKRKRKKEAKKVFNSQNLEIFIKENENVLSEKPIGLCFSLLSDDRQPTIKPRVEGYLKKRYNKEIPVYEVSMNAINSMEDRIELVNKIKQIRREIDVTGATEAHLFIAGPITAGVIIGAVLDNWIKLVLYSKSRNEESFYDYWMPLPKQMW